MSCPDCRGTGYITFFSGEVQRCACSVENDEETRLKERAVDRLMSNERVDAPEHSVFDFLANVATEAKGSNPIGPTAAGAAIQGAMFGALAGLVGHVIAGMVPKMGKTQFKLYSPSDMPKLPMAARKTKKKKRRPKK
jgi:hypothetical protein